MPEMVTAFDRLEEPTKTPLDDPDAFRPKTGWQAVLRGAFNRCPRCEQRKLFRKFLKPIDRCESCGQDWSLHQADDFPPYVAILVTGHVLAPVIIALIGGTDMPLWVLWLTIMALAVALMITILQPAKGAIIALQWWLGMHGFSFQKPASDTDLANDNRP